MDYQQFIQSKKHTLGDHGFDPVWMPDCAFDFQENIITKAVRKGRMGVFAHPRRSSQVPWSAEHRVHLRAPSGPARGSAAWRPSGATRCSAALSWLALPVPFPSGSDTT